MFCEIQTIQIISDKNAYWGCLSGSHVGSGVKLLNVRLGSLHLSWVPLYWVVEKPFVVCIVAHESSWHFVGSQWQGQDLERLIERSFEVCKTEGKCINIHITVQFGRHWILDWLETRVGGNFDKCDIFLIFSEKGVEMAEHM